MLIVWFGVVGNARISRNEFIKLCAEVIEILYFSFCLFRVCHVTGT